MASNANRPAENEIDNDLEAPLNRLAETCPHVSHGLMREAMTGHVGREEKREAFCKDAFDAWEAYRTAGLHASAEEANRWLAELEQGNDIDPPEFHT
jgi:predicted transcriptional regulator